MGKRRTRSDSESSMSDPPVVKQFDSDGNEVYSVEVITQAKVFDNGKGRPVWKYRVQWYGYDRDEDTWEPMEELNVSCPRLTQSFWGNFNDEDKDYQIGDIVKPPMSWIADEIRYFKDELKQDLERRSKKRRTLGKKAEKKGKGRKSSASSPAKSPSRTPRSSMKGKAKADSSESSSEEETPLASLSKKPEPKSSLLPAEEVHLYKSASLLRKERKAKGQTPDFSLSQLPVLPVFREKRNHSKILIPPAKFPRLNLPNRLPNPQRSESIPSPSDLISPSVSQRVSSANSSHTLSPTMAPSVPSAASKVATSSIDQRKSNTVVNTAFFSSRKTAPLPRRTPLLSREPAPSTSSGQSKQLSVATATNVPSSSTDAVLAKKIHNMPSFKKNKVPQAGPSTIANLTTPLESSRAEPSRDPRLRAPLPLPATSSRSSQAPSIPPAHHPPPSTSDDLFGGTDDWRRLSPATETHESSPPKASMDTVNKFLQSAMPAEMAAPLDSSLDPLPTPPAPGARRLTGTDQGTLTITQKYRWAGKVELEIPGKAMEHLCDAVLTDCTPGSANTVHFSHVLTAKVSSLYVPSLHDLQDLPDFLRACTEATQLARLGPLEDKDKARLREFAEYLTQTRRVILVPVRMDKHPSGHVLLFPHIFEDLVSRFSVPDDLREPNSLVAVLLPWKLSLSAQQSDPRPLPSELLPSEVVHEKFVLDPVRWNKLLSGSNARYQLALRTLDFPKALHDFMAREAVEGAAWYEGGDGSREIGAGLQTLMLYSIWEKTKVKPCGSSHPKLIFIHVGAMKTLNQYQHLAKRRGIPNILFYTYGFHESVPIERWGVRLVFPFGGVVTFTTQSLLEYPSMILNTIKNIAQHPFWTCYILPEVLGAAARLVCQGAEESIASFDRGNFMFKWLLEFVEQGKVAVMRSPPHTRTPQQSQVDPWQLWSMEQIAAHTPRTLLEFCLEQYQDRYRAEPDSRIEEKMLNDIESDLTSLQMHPTVFEEWRRFVVLRGEKQRNGNGTAFEWVVPSEFSMQDNVVEKKKSRVSLEAS